MKTSDFDYDLPKTLIAYEPTSIRDNSRLMVIERSSQKILGHYNFFEITKFLTPGDIMVLNDTKVFKARLLGKKAISGGKVEVFLVRKLESTDSWEAIIKGNPKIDSEIIINDPDFKIKVVGREKQKFYVKLLGEDAQGLINRYGHIPLPPYIKRQDNKSDQERYQTVYAKNIGAVAAPTAGFHFSSDLLTKIKDLGVKILYLTLHVGLGTFKPVKEEVVERHKMEEEFFVLPESVAIEINQAKQAGRRVIAVGTTSIRALESSITSERLVETKSSYTNIFIYPPYIFNLPDALITNFHLPKSTLLMLVSAFAGKDLIMEAYREAIARNYRFYSYGDAMMII
ncbi:MAG: tRNA preQ1(34) S-adenosylmethionine ribosyltransferase-isomerase QueA [bacterium]